MIPVLDYLGKLGVSKSTFTDFLRRCPQVLQASVVVYLEPVVKYLQGLDIKPNDIPRVFEKYPKILGFKIEGTMSTLVAYLVGIGVKGNGRVLTRYPEILRIRVGRIIKPFIEDSKISCGKSNGLIFLGARETKFLNSEPLFTFNVRDASLASVIAQYPEIVGLDLKPKLQNQQSFLSSTIMLDPLNFGRVVEKMPQVVSLCNAAVLRHVDFIMDCGFFLQ
ncbi:Transcription termination factor, mitochondrial/chloroplastic [Dillenia turbinata]|uniref:Transcription termination factor, mitochondrial/chloroplastic n=1 Tax=Dillenia turbinata TaxID=194707 RepID=A0AAN8UIU2_9MAGN